MAKYYNGYRPFIGWVCGICIAIYYIPHFILGNIMWYQAFLKTGMLSPYPISIESLLQLVGVVLGISAFRTFEKIKSVDK